MFETTSVVGAISSALLLPHLHRLRGRATPLSAVE
jgi:hypothetical protein